MRSIRSPLDGFASPFGRRASGGAAFSVDLTGLSTDTLGTYGQVGNHAAISYTATQNGSPITLDAVKWSASSAFADAATFGTGANPTAFTAADGFSVYLHGQKDGEWVTRSFTARKAPATAGAALDLSFVEDSAITSTDLAQNFTANGNTLAYLLVDTPPAGLSATGQTLTGTPTTITADANYTFQGTDEYGRVVSVEHAIEITETNLVTELTMGSVTYTFSAPVEAGLDQTGRAYVVDPGAGVTVTAISPAQTTDGGGDVINGAQKNFGLGGVHGLDERLGWSAAANTTVSISLVAGDRLVKVISDLDAVFTDRDGSIAEFACLHCVTTAPTATQVLGPTSTFPGDTLPEVYDFDLDAFYAARTTQSAANITWFDFNEVKARLGQFWPTFYTINYTSDGGYQTLSPRGFGSPASDVNANYGRYIALSLGDFMLATTVAAGAQFTEAQIKEAILITLMHGIEWGLPFAYRGSSIFSAPADGGHHQFHQGPSAFALHALGLDAKIPDLMEDNGQNWRQAFQITSLADFAPHTLQFKPWFARERTLSTQPGGSTLSLPFNIPGFGYTSGFDMQRDSGMPAGTRIVRKSDGVTAVTSASFTTPNTSGNPVYLDISLTDTNPFSSGDVVTMLPPVDSPIQIGSYDWVLRGTGYPADFSPSFNTGYRDLQWWGGAILALRAHGITSPLIDVAQGYVEWARLANKPSATNDYPSFMAAIASEYYTENWDPAWSVLTSPDAFVVGNWTLDSGGVVSISALPDNGGALIDGIDYRLNGGSWVAATGINNFSVVHTDTISFTIPAYAGEDVEIRASNIIGDSAASDVKSEAVASFDPATLFASGEQGIWIDPSDLTTLWQDTAKTSQVTADGQTVRAIDDKSGRNNHLTSTTGCTYKTDGTLHWLEFDGTNDCLYTSAVDFSASDSLAHWVGARRDQDASARIMLELSETSNTNAGTFNMFAPGGTSERRFTSAARGSEFVNTNQSSAVANPAAPDTCVLTSTHSISGDLTTLSRNRVAAPNGTGDKGTGNFGSAYPIYVGARGNSSLYFDGAIYGLIIRGGTSTSQQIADAEDWIAAKTGVTL